MKRLFLLALGLFMGLNGFAQKKGKLQPLQTDIQINLLGPVEKGGQQFWLEFVTQEIFECENTLIVAEKLVEGDRVTIKLKGYMDPEVCLTALGPAKARIDLSELAPGTYQFKAQYRNYDPFLASLVISADKWKFVVEEEAMISIGRPVLQKIPAQTVWALLEYYSEADRAAVNAFITDLGNEQWREAELPIGAYHAFYLREKGRQAERKVEGGGFEQLLTGSYQGDFERLKLLVKMYGEKHPGVRISLFDAKGNVAVSGS